MKKFLFFTTLIAILIGGFSLDADAQYRKKKKKKKKKKAQDEYFDDSGFVHKLWYGSDAVFRFGGFNGSTELTYGLSPMVAYKLTDNLSAGPKVTFNNYIVNFANGTQDDIKFKSFNYGAGIFARYKIFNSYFIHGEFEGISEEIIPDLSRIEIDPATNEILTERQWNNHYYLGAGYTSGGTLAINIYLLWDFSEEFNSSNIPINYRFGLTYKF